MFPEALMEGVLCTRGEEDCSNLLFECMFAREIWTIQPISREDVSSAGVFYAFLGDGVPSRQVKQ